MLDNKKHVTYFSVGTNVLLTAVKLTVGLITGSTAILSEAVHSGSDLITSIVAMVSVSQADKPPDADHPYGHGKYENIGSLVEAVIIFISGALIFNKALKELFVGVELKSLDLGIWVMLFSAVANLIMSTILINKGKELDSPVIEADGWHSRTDVFTATGVMISLVIVKYTGSKIIDPLIAIAVAAVIVWISLKISLEAIKVLVDTKLPSEIEEKLKKIIVKHENKFIEFHHFRTRKLGSQVQLDLHLVFPDDTPLKQAHDLTEEIEKEVSEVLPDTTVLIHIEPCDAGKNVKKDCQHKNVESGRCMIKKGDVINICRQHYDKSTHDRDGLE